MISDDDVEGLDSRIEDAARVKFDNMVNELAVVLQQQANEALKRTRYLLIVVERVV